MLYIACCTKRIQLALLSRWLNKVNILRFMSIYSLTVRIYVVFNKREVVFYVMFNKRVGVFYHI
jgi:hypothetical protein